MQRQPLSAAAAAVAFGAFCAIPTQTSLAQSVIQLPGVQPAAVDQPRVNIAFARPDSLDAPLFGTGIFLDPNDPDPFGGGVIEADSVLVEAFFDTGASGAAVISLGVANELGFNFQEVGGQPVIFSDVGANGSVDFAVSEPLEMFLADSLGIFDGLDADRLNDLIQPDPFNVNGTYTRSIGPIRAQVGPVDSSVLPDIQPPLGDLGLTGSDINVVGMPAMDGRVIVMDTKPTNEFDDFFNGVLGGGQLPDDLADLDVFMRTFSYAPGTPFSGNELDPGIPDTNLHVSLSYADFGKFTTITPDGAEPPTSISNPFIGPNPLGVNAGNGGNDDAPPLVLSYGGASVEGSWLLDTGAAASFVSEQLASQLGVSYAEDAGIGTENPRLDGVPLSQQFTLAIQGIDGNPVEIAGFFADSLALPTDEGMPLVFGETGGAPVLVLDIELRDPETGEIVILDGIFGMNFLTQSVELIDSGLGFPLPGLAVDSPFDFITFDEPNGKLGFALPGVVIPEPAMLGLLAAAPLLRRRRSA
ncbi:MAG: hypothetical protein AAGD32_06315 [Planctomycetota bacterium]